MAKKSTAIVRAEKVAAAAKRRATNLREKMKKDQPLILASTVIGGGGLDGFIQASQPEWLTGLGVDSSLLVGGVLVGYGLFSDRSGQMEKTATAIGTGVLTCYVSRMAESYISEGA
jgi:hypothetical protein